MPSPTQRRGGRAELRAVFYLRRHGYTILAQHVTSRFGEIDIVCQKGNTLYLVEVKYRFLKSQWPIEISMSQKKIERIVLTWQASEKHFPDYIGFQPRLMWLLITKHTLRQILL